MCKGTEHWEEPGSRGVSAARLGEEPRESSEVKGSGFSSVGAHCFEYLEQAKVWAEDLWATSGILCCGLVWERNCCDLQCLVSDTLLSAASSSDSPRKSALIVLVKVAVRSFCFLIAVLRPAGVLTRLVSGINLFVGGVHVPR